METILNLGIFLALVLIGYLSGTAVEKRHYRSLRARERAYQGTPVVTLRALPDDRPVREVRLVTGCAVISVDYFKSLLAGLRGVFGGEVAAYETLIDRARREAVLRLREAAADADRILNLRIDTAPIGEGSPKTTASVEALASGTAVYYAK